MVYIIMVLILAGIFILAYFSNKKDIIAPSVIFPLAFLFSATWGLFYFERWGLEDYSFETALYIVVGVLDFVLVSFVVKKIFSRKYKDKDVETAKKEEIKPIIINKWTKIFILCFFALTLFAYLNSVIEIVGGSWDNIISATYQFDRIKFTDQIVTLPLVVRALTAVAHPLAYWLLYVFVNNLIAKKKADWLILGSIIIEALICLASGSRGGLIYLLIAGVIMAIIIARKKRNNKKITLTKKQKIIIVSVSTAAIAIILAFFPISAKIMRNSNSDPLDYLSIYCGAPIKNFDTFVKEYSEYESDGNSQTFVNIVNTFGADLGLAEKYKILKPFRSINGYGLGNVYTTFYPFLQDYGFPGIIILTAIMAAISQFVYEMVKREKFNQAPLLFTIIYGYMFSKIMGSFFANTFYETIFSRQFIVRVLVWTGLCFYYKNHEKILENTKVFLIRSKKRTRIASQSAHEETKNETEKKPKKK